MLILQHIIIQTYLYNLPHYCINVLIQYMNSSDKLREFIENQFLRSELRLKQYISAGSWKYPQRQIVYHTRMLRDRFLSGVTDPRVFIIPGIRGVGKTTALAQTYFELKEKLKSSLDPRSIIYVSTEEITTSLGSNLNEFFAMYEKVINTSYEALDHNVFFFIDEVQYDPDWSIAIKILRDKSNKVLVYCSGSSAISLNTDTNLARRSKIERLFPTSFCEFVMIKDNIYPIYGLKEKIREAIFNSTSAKEVYEKLDPLQNQIGKYYAKTDIQIASNTYLRVGTLPFAAAMRDETEAFDKIAEVLRRIISDDIPQFVNFRSENIPQLNRLLFILSDKNTLSLEKLASEVGVSKPQIEKMLDAFEKAEVLTKFRAYGSKSRQSTNPSKYLFMTPAFRASYYDIIARPETYKTKLGNLLEDVVGMYLYRMSKERIADRILLFYDSNKDGADFVINSLKLKGNIILEVGMGEKSIRQVRHSMSKIPSLYGATISKNSLSLNEAENIVHIPLRTFLLL
jgi:predicted AAA+ superfamily ATPase